MSKWVPLVERLPEKSGVYPACSTIEGRSMPTDWVDAIYMFEADAKPGKCKWQHGSGFYDNGLTHWLELSGPAHD